jgi:hypothetical protein
MVGLRKETRVMTLEEMEQNIVRRGALMPCRTAFIDAHTPGSNQKENFHHHWWRRF